jgi:3-hydroxymyristoyl/3-hydroxydecanoyl-(acyl carrier protein) dehydratase
MISTRLRIAADHPSLPGHFPGRPLVPGVIVLDRVVAAIERECGARIVALPQVKFASPLLPEQDAELHIEEKAGRLHFNVQRDGMPVASGIAETESTA